MWVFFFSCLALSFLISASSTTSQEIVTSDVKSKEFPEILADELVVDFKTNQEFIEQRNAISTSRGVTIKEHKAQALLKSDIIEAPIPFASLGIQWTILPQEDSLIIQEDSLIINVRGSKDAKNWSDWVKVTTDRDLTEEDSNEFFGSLIFFGRDTKFIQYSIELGTKNIGTLPNIQELKFVFIDPGETAKENLTSRYQQENSALYGQQNLPTKPPVVSRTGWGCPDGQSSPSWRPEYTTVTHLILHHTDTTNSATDWPAEVRSIWYYHTYTRGWGDIGYNYLIDPNGAIYEGRAGGDNVIGAHFSCQNANTMGVALLGKFTSIVPTSVALTSLEKLLAWKCSQSDIDPLGITFHSGTRLNLFNISGHRDGNPSQYVCTTTTCPGDAFYSLLTFIRTAVDNLITGGCSISVGQGAPTTDIQNKFIDAYDFDGSSVLGCPTNTVGYSTNNLYSIPVYYQTFQGGQSGQAQINFVPGYPAAYNIKYGFYQTFQSVDEGMWGYSGTGEPVYRLLVAPTDFENNPQYNPPDPSNAGTSYNWQPFIKGSVYYYVGNANNPNLDFKGWISYVWGDIADRYELQEGGPAGFLGLPLSTQLHYGSFDGWDWWFQWFEKGFIWYAKQGDQRWTYAYRWTGNSVYESGSWIRLGWCYHSAGLPLSCLPP